jgi:hypothetical protein
MSLSPQPWSGSTRLSGTESAFHKGERHHALKVTFVAAHPQEAAFQTIALATGLELPVGMVGQRFAPPGEFTNESRVARFD